MSKPTIFFSHSSQDQKQLARLKELFVQKTGGSIDVFLSSDGQSIPLGRNWVHQIEKALDSALVMIVFVSPDSMLSNWLYFESGFAYSKRIRVVPVGFLGIDLGDLFPPLSLLQGFNIKSEAGLNNILALANEVFKHAHTEVFTADEFRSVCGETSNRAVQVFGRQWSFIEELTVNLSPWSGLDHASSKALETIQTLFDREGLDYALSAGAINLHGITFQARRDMEEEPLQIKVDPGLADIALPIIERSIRAIRSKDGVRGVKMRLDFHDIVGCVAQHYKITARVYGTDVRLASGDDLIMQDIRFRIGQTRFRTDLSLLPGGHYSLGAAFIETEMLSDQIPTDQIAELLSFLFDHEILFVSSRR